MPLIRFLPDDRKIEVRDGESILDAALRTGITMAHICGGKSRCSTCRVLVMEGLENCSSKTTEEQDIADQLGFSPEIRLACQTRLTGNAKVRRLILDEHDVELNSRFIMGKESGLVGVEKHVFIMFLDIRGFTAFAESLLPYDVIHVLNRFFHFMNQVIRRHGGYIDNYMGDGFMALFEVDDPESGALSAVKAGLGMLTIVKDRMSPYVANLFGKTFEVGIGLHYGLVVAGTVGYGENINTTVIGDAVNFASRIESANKEMGTNFLISKDVYEYPKVSSSIQFNRTFHIKIPGKTGVQTLYEVISFKENN
jgi:adenylate cyclase